MLVELTESRMYKDYTQHSNCVHSGISARRRMRLPLNIKKKTYSRAEGCSLPGPWSVSRRSQHGWTGQTWPVPDLGCSPRVSPLVRFAEIVWNVRNVLCQGALGGHFQIDTSTVQCGTQDQSPAHWIRVQHNAGSHRLNVQHQVTVTRDRSLEGFPG